MFCSVSEVSVTLAGCKGSVNLACRGVSPVIRSGGGHVTGCLRKSVAVSVIFIFKELYMLVRNSGIKWAAGLEASRLLQQMRS